MKKVVLLLCALFAVAAYADGPSGGGSPNPVPTNPLPPIPVTSCPSVALPEGPPTGGGSGGGGGPDLPNGRALNKTTASVSRTQNAAAHHGQLFIRR